MEELKALLENYFVVKNKDKSLFYSIKDNIKNIKKFTTEKLGYSMIIRNDFIKLEKLPGRAESWMGIEEFSDKNEYVLFVLVLMFLEDKDKDEQFLLSHIVEYISANSVNGEIDWTVYKLRRQLVKVIKYCIKLHLLAVNEEEEKDFAQNIETEALYESTGLSKYVIRDFDIDIMKIRDYKDLEEHNKNLIDSERGFIRRNRVYRRLLLTPIVYNEGAEDEDYKYIKNYKSHIEEDFKKNLNWNLHVHKNGAMLVPEENEHIKNSFPSTAGISDVVLHVNKYIYEMVMDGVLKRLDNDTIEISESDFTKIVEKVKLYKSQGWYKECRECSLEKLCDEVIQYMIDFCMLEKKQKIHIMPLVAKLIGDYPEKYNEEYEYMQEVAVMENNKADDKVESN